MKLKEFWHKHHKLILISGGLVILFYVLYKWYENEQANAASAQNAADAANLASQLSAASLPLLYGGTGSSIGSLSTTPTTIGPTLGNYVGATGTNQSTTTTATTNPAAGTSATATGIVSPSIVSTVAPVGGASPYLSQGSGPCQYALPGVAPAPGVPVCGPGGYVPPTLNPCDPGYEANSSGAFGQPGTGDAAVPVQPPSCNPANGENSTTPAGGTQTSAPVSSSPGSTTSGNQRNIGGIGGIGGTSLGSGRGAASRLPVIRTGVSTATGLPTVYGSLPAASTTTGLPVSKPSGSASSSLLPPNTVNPVPIRPPIRR
jgi:hypothetical protein